MTRSAAYYDGFPRKLSRVALSHLCVAVCGIFLSLVAESSRAAEWSFEPSVGLRTEYNTNVQLTPDPHPAAWGMILTPDVKFSGATEALTVTGGLNLGFTRYLHQPQFNIDSYDLSLRSSYKTERDVLNFDLDAIRDATVVSELATTGVVLAYSPRNQFTVTPSWSRALTEATSINASYGYTNVNYHATSGTSPIGYQEQVASVGMQTKLDEGKVLNLAAYYDRYETPPPQTLENTFGVHGGYDHAFSETLHGTLLVGWRWTQSTLSSQTSICDGPIINGICSGMIIETTTVQKQNNSGLTLNANLEKQSETDTVRGEISQEIYPSGAGSLVQTQRVAVKWNKQWSPMLSSNIDGAAYRIQYIGGAVTSSSNSRYYSFNSSLSWRFRESLKLDVGYTYSRNKYDSAPVAANANVLYLMLSYAWPKLSVSR